MNKTEKIILIPNTQKNIDKITLDALVTHLKKKGCSLAVFPNEAEIGLPGAVHVIEDADEIKEYDAVLVLGGDGSIIEAGHRLVGYDIPVLGINFGHIGFLTELEESEMPLLDELISGNYETDERMMLDALVTDRNGKEKAEYTVLNDIVLTNGPVARMLTFDVYCNREKVQTVRADGIIIATPTGSTAYSLSAGGAVLDPTLDGMAVTPICPHMLSSRPLVFRGDAEITVSDVFANSSTVYLNADGRDVVEIENGDTITIRKSRHKTKLVRIKKTSFVSVFEAKLSEHK